MWLTVIQPVKNSGFQVAMFVPVWGLPRAGSTFLTREMVPFSSMIVSLWMGCFLLSSLLTLSGAASPETPMLEFSKEPPAQLDFSNNTGAKLDCQVTGTPPISLSWIFQDGTPVTNVSGIRQVNVDGTMVFMPFSSESFRQDVHAALYKCRASNVAGTIVSREVKVRAVMDIEYDSNVYDVFAIRGNTAVIKCHIPNFLENFVSVVAYIRDDTLKIATPIISDEKFSLSPSGSLYIKNAGSSDAGTKYRCQTLPRLNGHMKTSTAVGRLFVNEPQGNVPPKIVDSLSTIEIREGEAAVLPCIAQGYPTPIIQWFIRSVVGDLLLGTHNGQMKQVSNGLIFTKSQLSDSGLYICRANNTVGSDQVEISLSVTAPLRAEVKPRIKSVAIGHSLRLDCAIGGYPVTSVWWLRNGQVLNNSARVTASRDSLQIQSITLEDKGIYQCFARNDKETVQGASEVRLGDFSPIFRATFKERTMQPGPSFNISCVVAGNPQPEVKWTLDSLPLEPSSKLSISRALNLNGHVMSTLALKSTSVQDGGVYTCIGVNVHGKAQHSERINIYGPLGVRNVPVTTAVAGEDTHLFCPVYGFPIENVKWEKDSISIPLSMRQAVHENGTLTINAMQKKTDAGNYLCTATNAKGQKIKAKLNVRVLVAPKVVPFAFQEELLREGVRARIQCVVSEGDAPVKIEWTRNGEAVTTDHRTGITVQDVDEFSSFLAIRSVNPKHNGNYTCVAKNAAGVATYTAPLFVNALPKVIPFAFQDDQNFKGMRAHIICAVSQGDLPLDFQWLKDDQKIDQTLGATIGSYDRHSSSLSIDNVVSKHSGNYSCVVTNEAGKASFTAQLMVQVGPKVRTLSFNDASVQEGVNTGASCILAEGDPPVSFHWKKDGQPASSLLGVHVVTPNEFTSLLSISGTKPAHTGNYSCTASNLVGFVTSVAQLVVNVAPKIVPFTFQGDQMFEGVLARVSCVVYQGDLPITIRWEKEGRAINPNSGSEAGISIRNVDDFTSILTIDNVQFSKHSGNYSCVAKNSAAAVSHTAQLVVKVPPKIVPFSFQDEALVEGMFVRVSCIVSRGDLPLSITWAKDGKPIPENRGIVIRRIDDYSSVLSIDTLSPRQAGNYTCIATNEASTAIFSAELSVHVPPYWIKQPSQILSVVHGNHVRFDCEAGGFPKPMVSWMVEKASRNFKKIVDGEDGLRLFPNGSLYISSVEGKHKANYFCKATNGIGVGLDQAVRLEVHSPTKIITESGRKMVIRYGNVTIQCAASGDHPISFTWAINGKSVDHAKQTRFRISQRNDTKDFKAVSELHLLKAVKSDNSVITCTARNPYGKDVSNTTLVVQGPPDPPQTVKAVDKGYRTTEITWAPPFDGHSPITKYVIEHQKLGSGKTNSSVVNGNVNSTLIEHLEPSSSYKFTVYAENAIGRSETGGVAELVLAGEAPTAPPIYVEIQSLETTALKVSWQPPPRSSWNGNIRGYYVGYREEQSSEPYEFKMLEVPEGYEKGLSFTISELKEFSRYSIVVQAFNDQGKGPVSEEVLAMTSEGVPSESPDDVRCSSISSKSMSVSWKRLPEKSVNGILRGYRVMYWPVNLGGLDEGFHLNMFNATEARKVILDNLNTFTNYSVQVLGYTLVGDGVGSNPIFCTTLEDVPGPPESIRAITSSADSVLVAWKPPLKPNGKISHFTVHVENVENRQEKSRHSVNGNVSSYVIHGLKKGQKYKFQVSASSRMGEGRMSYPVYEYPNGPNVPAKCASFDQILRRPVGHDVLLICPYVGVPPPQQSWFFSGQQVSLNKRATTKSDGSLMIESIQLSDSGNYTCRVGNDFGQDQITYSLIVQAPPSPPSLLITSTTFSNVGLLWKMGSNGNSPIIRYVLHYKPELGNWQSVELQPYLNMFLLGGLHCGTTYQIYMVATNIVGASQPSDTLTVTTTGGVPEVPPIAKLIEESTTHVVLQLDAWIPNGCPILYFVVEYKRRSLKNWHLFSNQLNFDKPTALVGDLDPGTWYNLRMTAHTSAGSAVAEFEFATLTLNEETIPGVMFEADHDLFARLNLHVALPTTFCVVTILLCISVTLFWVKRKRNSQNSGKRVDANRKKNHKKQRRSASLTDLRANPKKKRATSFGSDDTITPYATVKLSDIQRKEAKLKSERHCSLPRNAGSLGMPAWQMDKSAAFSGHAYNPSAPPMSESYGKPLRDMYPIEQAGRGFAGVTNYPPIRKEKIRPLREGADLGVAVSSTKPTYPSIPTKDESMETTFIFPPPPDDLRDGDYDPPPPDLDWLPVK